MFRSPGALCTAWPNRAARPDTAASQLPLDRRHAPHRREPKRGRERGGGRMSGEGIAAGPSLPLSGPPTEGC